MAKLHSLIKFKRHELDEKREVLARLNSQLEMLHDKKKMLLDNLAHEKNLAAVDIESARNFGHYLKRVQLQQAALDDAIRDKMQEIQAATIVVQEAFLEAKKLEITQEKSDATEAARIGKIEADNLDEIGLELFRRKDDNHSN